ncbi:hypothetical protein [Dyadobacter fermentans]|uniref:hypothetical protein n=1 Tax=Dyadobacter fermentans TaxID=94254 RepID=UPI00019B59FC|nr:hypothetical protein [Dyadobacter fermentans]
MGQINLVLIGQHYINPNGSFTRTSGVLAEDPIVYSAAVTTVNGAINAFAVGAAVSIAPGVRVNAVAPGLAENSPFYFSFFPGFVPASMHRIAQAYVKSVHGVQTGQVYRVA